MELHEINKAISEVTDKSALFLIHPLSAEAGFFTTDGKLLYISKDNDNYATEGIDTEYLSLQTHVRITAVSNAQSFPNDDYNIILYRGELLETGAKSFVELCSIHSKNKSQLSFKDFFYSLIALFQLPTEQGFTNAVGLFGELKLMQYVQHKYKKDISPFWHHSGPHSRYDFSNGKDNIEVKCTAAGDTKVTIKHSQIFGDHPCYLAAVFCDQYDGGQTISELVNEMQHEGEAFKTLNFSINLAKELKRVSKQEVEELRFSLTGLMLFTNEEINPFLFIPDGISNLSYRLDLSVYEPLDENKERSFFVNY